MQMDKKEGPFYHGTKARLQPGDLIRPGFGSNYREGFGNASCLFFCIV
jgi:hypothetical protein